MSSTRITSPIGMHPMIILARGIDARNSVVPSNGNGKNSDTIFPYEWQTMRSFRNAGDILEIPCRDEISRMSLITDFYIPEARVEKYHVHFYLRAPDTAYAYALDSRQSHAPQRDKRNFFASYIYFFPRYIVSRMIFETFVDSIRCSFVYHYLYYTEIGVLSFTWKIYYVIIYYVMFFLFTYKYMYTKIISIYSLDFLKTISASVQGTYSLIVWEIVIFLAFLIYVHRYILILERCLYLRCTAGSFLWPLTNMGKNSI